MHYLIDKDSPLVRKVSDHYEMSSLPDPAESVAIDLDAPLHVPRIEAGGNIVSNVGIVAMGNGTSFLGRIVSLHGSILVSGKIIASEVRADGSIEVESINSEGDIFSGDKILSEGDLVSQGNLVARRGISAGGKVFARETIFAGTGGIVADSIEGITANQSIQSFGVVRSRGPITSPRIDSADRLFSESGNIVAIDGIQAKSCFSGGKIIVREGGISCLGTITAKEIEATRIFAGTSPFSPGNMAFDSSFGNVIRCDRLSGEILSGRQVPFPKEEAGPSPEIKKKSRNGPSII